MKHIATLVIIFGLALGCTTSKEAVLDQSQALRLGMDYAKQKRWDVKSVWKSVTFDRSTREWQMFFDVEPYAGPFIVYVNDKTKKIRFERGE